MKNKQTNKQTNSISALRNSKDFREFRMVSICSLIMSTKVLVWSIAFTKTSFEINDQNSSNNIELHNKAFGFILDIFKPSCYYTSMSPLV